MATGHCSKSSSQETLSDPLNHELLVDLTRLNNGHYTPGPLYQCAQKLQALLLMPSDELEAIYHLSESHSPGLRYKAVYRYERTLCSTDKDKQFTLNKQHVQFSCANEDIKVKIDKMLKKVEEMPEEWTLIQLTSEYYKNENMELVKSDCTVPIYISVFNCGKNQPKPFCIKVDTPVDKISGKVIGIKEEMESIIHENKYGLKDIQTENGFFKSHLERRKYIEKRVSLNNRLRLLVKDLGDLWLKEWRCLFVGKFFNEENFDLKLKCILEEMQEYEITEKTRCILKCVIKASANLLIEEIRDLLIYCFPQKKLKHKIVAKLIKEMSQEADLCKEKQHPIILVIDEKLDIFPWEMLDVLQDHPVSRMPSLHFTYGLFKEHEGSIVNGIKADVNPEKGSYIINPGCDLKDMQIRMHNFFKYWRPKWTGPVGKTPSTKEFEGLLKKSDIFSYNGHGDGSQFISGETIEKLRINSVVLLFGCGSVKNIYQGPRVEMYGSHHTYLIACSPCVVGMLWEVTDRDTDILASEFWSRWLPTTAAVHWKNVDKAKWEATGQITPLAKKCQILLENEPELLRVLSRAKKAARQYLTQASCVARGIPVKLNITEF